MPATDYEFFFGKPGLFLEIYLPKTAQFQPLLFRVFNDGFNLGRVRAHFRSNKGNDIRRFLRRNRELRHYTVAAIRNFQNVFRVTRFTKWTARSRVRSRSARRSSA
jgi:hypothetical protein